MERKKKCHKLPVKQFWLEHCAAALAQGKLAYSYQSFCEQFSAAAERLGATQHFRHTPGEKAYIDWAGDTAELTDGITGKTTKVYVLVVAPSSEMRFYTLEEFNEFCAERVAWLNGRPLSAKDGSRGELFEAEEAEQPLPLPLERYEMCRWCYPKVSPDYHVTVDYMHYSVPHTLIGRTLEAKVTAGKVVVYDHGELVCEHRRMTGRKNQYDTFVEHMPANHRDAGSPWSRERFTSWAAKIGPETEAAVARVLDSRAVMEQAFVPCRNILGLSKRYTPQLLEAACAQVNALGALPSYTGVKNTVLSIKADAELRRAASAGPRPPRTAGGSWTAPRMPAGSAARRERKIAKLNREAGFKLPAACVKDIVYLPDRKLSRDRVAWYASCKWIEDNEVLVIISKTGCGKSYLCQALGNSACRHLHGVAYTQMADMLMELNRARAHADGSYLEAMDRLKTVKLPIVDDFMTTPISTRDAVDLFEIMEAREGRQATLIASQLEPEE